MWANLFQIVLTSVSEIYTQTQKSRIDIENPWIIFGRNQTEKWNNKSEEKPWPEICACSSLTREKHDYRLNLTCFFHVERNLSQPARKFLVIQRALEFRLHLIAQIIKRFVNEGGGKGIGVPNKFWAAILDERVGVDADSCSRRHIAANTRIIVPAQMSALIIRIVCTRMLMAGFLATGGSISTM